VAAAAVKRKSVEPMAAVTAPARAAAQHQALLHFVGNAPWSDEAVLAKVRELVLPSIERNGPIEAWIIDDTGFPKKGRHSVGVMRQYCGQPGKQDNCQVALTLSLANHDASLPVAYRLYVPEDWAADPVRRAKTGIPESVEFATKPAIALAQLRAAYEAGLPRGVVLMDAGYGGDPACAPPSPSLVCLTHPVEYNGMGTRHGALAAAESTGRVRPSRRLRRDTEHQPVQVKALARSLPASAWETITWREGSADWLTSRYTRMRVYAPPIATNGSCNRTQKNGY
jgi:SRSO17 transposase